MIKEIRKYSAQAKKKKVKSFFDIAKKHIVKSTGPKENLALNIDRILYGK